jgi:hypothetical protein
MVYQFKPGSKLPGDPQRVGHELDRIRSTSSGLTRRAVVDTARSTKHYLHRYFTWDDQAAAELYREEEAGHLIRSVVVVCEQTEPTTTVRAFVTLDSSGGQYLSTVRVLSQTDLRAQLLAKAREELRWFREKYKTLNELAEVIRVIDDELDEG